MSRIYFLSAIAAFLVLCFAGVPALAWDTRVIACPPGAPCEPAWTSIYLGGSSPSVAEHTTISNLALKQLGVHDIFGKRGSATANVTDLNASWLRREHFADTKKFGDDRYGKTILEERQVPPPAHFTGVPDYSYSVLDWINKNSFCPPFKPGDYPEKCHHFVGWLGGFNSPHFGSQAKDMYVRYHSLALDIAGRAAGLRARLGDDSEEKAHANVVKEMELEALAFEGFAQHFLQDRWAIGHMWERWGAGDGPQMNIEKSAFNEKFLIGVGAVAGLLHGAESVISNPYGIVESIDNYTGVRNFLDAADPLSSPVIRNGVVVPMEWRHIREGKSGLLNPGVGDERFNDLYLEELTGTGQFGSGYGGTTQRTKDLPFSAARQFKEMMTCSRAGWAEVIRTFGKHSQGGYGEHKAPLASDAPTFAINNAENCWDMWATNESMYTGLIDDQNVPIKYLALIGGSAVMRAGSIPRGGLVALAGHMWIEKTVDPTGTSLATGGIGEFMGLKTADGYKLPKFVMPARVKDLPEEDGVGVDRKALYGLFNRAHSDYWCEGLEEKLVKLRGSEEEYEQQVCRYLADFAYQGTSPDYKGQQSRKRLFEDKPVRSICAVHGMKETEERDSLPLYLRPGYVPLHTPAPDPGAYSAPAVGYWCDMKPVLDLVKDEELANEDVVVNIKPGERDVYLRGVNLVGPTWAGQSTSKVRGTVALYNDDGFVVADIGNFHKWTDTAIHFDLPKDFGSDWRTGDFRVSIKRRDGVDSVGRFFLRISAKRPKVARVRALQDDEVFYDTEEDIFRPIPAGEVVVEVTFEDAMQTDDSKLPPSFLLGGDKLVGAWDGDRMWRGKVSHPIEGGSELRALSIQARSLEGGWIDGDADKQGSQPDTSYRLLLGTVPPILQHLTARAEGDVIYEASWEGGSDLKSAKNVTDEKLFEVLREFSIDRTDALPDSGELVLTLEFSQALSSAPAVYVEGLLMRVEGSEKIWTASLALAALHGATRAQVEVRNAAGNVLALDGNPRTQTAYDGVEGTWKRYEERRGGYDTGKGGVDTWHVLGEPPDLSFVIVLDASGSMDDPDGRMANAKTGIYSALAKLDDNTEVAVLAFNGCGNASTVGFTTDLEKVRSFVAGISPGGSTGLADTISQAREYLMSNAHPRSRAWRAAEFTDGEETCDGDVVGELYRLNAAILAYGKKDFSPSDIDEEILEDLEAAAEEEVKPSIVCQPDSWEGYEVEIIPSEAHLDRIRLIESHFLEDELPDGQCKLELKSETYGVYYGSGVGSGWGINSRPTKTDIKSAVSSDGRAKIQSLRNAAIEVRNKGTELHQAETEISEAVRRSLASE